MQFKQEKIGSSYNFQLSNSATCPGSLFTSATIPDVSSNYIQILPFQANNYDKNVYQAYYSPKDHYYIQRDKKDFPLTGSKSSVVKRKNSNVSTISGPNMSQSPQPHPSSGFNYSGTIRTYSMINQRPSMPKNSSIFYSSSNQSPIVNSRMPHSRSTQDSSGFLQHISSKRSSNISPGSIHVGPVIPPQATPAQMNQQNFSPIFRPYLSVGSSGEKNLYDTSSKRQISDKLLPYQRQNKPSRFYANTQNIKSESIQKEDLSMNVGAESLNSSPPPLPPRSQPNVKLGQTVKSLESTNLDNDSPDDPAPDLPPRRNIKKPDSSTDIAHFSDKDSITQSENSAQSSSSRSDDEQFQNNPKTDIVYQRKQMTNSEQEIDHTKNEKSKFECTKEAEESYENPYPRVIKHISSSVYRRFMEQKVANFGRIHKEREERLERLEKEMDKVSLEESQRIQMRNLLKKKESNHMRMLRMKMDQTMFDRLKRLGVGAFGKVWLVRKRDNGQLYAMKLLSKKDVVERRQLAHVQAERDILAEADNEWVVKLFFSFQDVHTLYLVMEYIPGGDMMSLLIKKGIFEEDLARFYTAELTLALESVHSMGFVHRDIKPDNILITKDGHIKLTDFGLCTGFRCTHSSKYWETDLNSIKEFCAKTSKKTDFDNDEDDDSTSEDESDSLNNPRVKVETSEELSKKNVEPNRLKHTFIHGGRMINDLSNRRRAQSLVGTPNYIAPEILRRKEYDKSCDWWSVGVILYEMLVGQPPFLAQTAMDTQIRVVQWKKYLRIPGEPRLEASAGDLICRLLRDPNERLSEPDLIKNHPYFISIPWNNLSSLSPPYIPVIKNDLDTSNFDAVDEDIMKSGAFSSIGSGSNSINQLPFPFFTFKRFFDRDTSVNPSIQTTTNSSLSGSNNKPIINEE